MLNWLHATMHYKIAHNIHSLDKYEYALNLKFILACQEVIKWVWPPMNQYRMFLCSYVGWMRGTLVYKKFHFSYDQCQLTSYITLLKLLEWSFSKRSKLMLSFNRLCIRVPWFMRLIVSVEITDLEDHTTLKLAQTLPPHGSSPARPTRENPT